MPLTVPLWTPPTRTSAPASKPATLSNCAFNWYVELKRYCLLPMMKTPTTRIASVATMKAPNRAALDIGPPTNALEILGQTRRHFSEGLQSYLRSQHFPH